MHVLDPDRADEGGNPGGDQPALMMVRLATIVLASGVSSSTATAPRGGDETPEAGLRWFAPTECPEGAEVWGTAGRLLGEARGALQRVEFVGAITSIHDGYVLDVTIVIEDRIESRHVPSNDCALLGHVAALLIAIAADAVATARSVPMVTESANPSRGLPGIPTVGPSANPRPTQLDPPATTSGSAGDPIERAQRRHSVEGGVDGGLGVGLTPGIGGGVEGYIGWRFGPWRVQALGFHWFEQPQRYDDDAGIVAALSGGGIRFCFALERRWLEVPLCIGLDLAALHGTGFGTAVDAVSYADLWVGLPIGVGFRARLARSFTLGARLELVPILRQPALHLVDEGVPVEVFRAPVAGLRLVLGPSVHSR